jgi:hypothetical protein
MLFRAPPMTFFCTHCGWKRTLIPSSDVVHTPPSCPKCGDGPVAHRMATKIEALVARFGFMRM